MGCLKMNDDEYIRMKNRMSIFNKRNSSDIDREQMEQIIKKAIEQAVSTSNADNKNRGFWKEHSGTIISCVLTAICTAVLSVFGNYLFLKVEINSINTQVEAMSTQVDGLVTDVLNISDYLYNDDGVKDQLGMINEALNLKVINVTEDDTVSLIEDVSVENNSISNTTSAFSAKMAVGVDSNGNVYIAEDLIGETVLLTYKDEGKDVFFLGQYNENYHWDGYCVTNAYNLDGTLYGICESNFEDGKRIDYKTVLCSSKDKNTWWYFERKCNGSVNEGISVRYILEYDKVKSFTNTNVRFTDILYADDFITSQDIEMTKYYYGNTSNGTYNDSTGNAYCVEYLSGYVKELYCGNFANGEYNDSTGNAWYIVKENDTDYMYYKGEFVDDEPIYNNGSESKKDLTMEQILEIIQDKEFDCSLEWK